MSVVDALARIQEIQASLAPQAQTDQGAAAAPAGGDGFATQLASASAGMSQNSLATVLGESDPSAGSALASALGSTGTAAGAPAAATTAPAGGAAPAGPGVPADVAPLVRAAAREAGVDPALVAAVAKAESGFNAAAVSPAGAQGMMQLMPGTARGLGVTNPFDAGQSLAAGARYLRAQLDAFGGDPSLALAAYNAGPGAVRRAGGVPPYAETQAYVGRVLGYYRELSAQGV